MDKRKKYYQGPSNIVYDIDGTSYGMDDDLVDAIRTSIRGRLRLGTLVIPRLPQVAGRILQLSQSGDVDFDEVTNVIMTDPVLAARILGTANSAAYSGTARVEGLSPALMRLGMKTVCNIVFAESVQTRVFSARAYREIVEQSWRLSLGSAIACDVLSRVTGVEREAAFLLGLLHDTGKPTLINAVSEYEHGNRGLVLGEATVEILVSQLHEEIGAHVLEQWDMPPAIVEAAGNHARYRGALDSTPSQRIVYAANLVCRHLGVGDTQCDVAFNLEHAFCDLGLDGREQVDRLLEIVSKDMENLMSGFGDSSPRHAENDAVTPPNRTRRDA